MDQVTQGRQVLGDQTKLITHAIRIAASHTATALARAIRVHTGYARGMHEARALPTGRVTAAIAQLCEHVTATQTPHPGTDLILRYEVKTRPRPRTDFRTTTGIPATVTAMPISRTDAMTATMNPKTNVRHIGTAVADVPERGADTPPGPTDCAAAAAEVPERVSGTDASSVPLWRTCPGVSSVPLWRTCPSVSSALCLATAALAEGTSNKVAPAPNTSVIAAPTASAFILLRFVVVIVSALPLREVRPLLAIGEPSQPRWKAVDQTSEVLPPAGGTPPTQGEVPKIRAYAGGLAAKE